MKIGLVGTEKLPVPAVKGGAIQIYLAAVAEILAREHEVTVFTIQDETLPIAETVGNVRYFRLEKSSYEEQLCEEIKKREFDLIHVCNRPKLMLRIAQVTRATLVLSVHNEMFAVGKISESEGRACLEQVGKVVTVSDFIKDTITARFPFANGKITTVYSGVEVEKYHPVWTSEGEQIRRNIRRKLGLDNRKILLSVGRLSKVKGQHILLQGLPNIVKEHPETMLVFVGSKWFGDNNINNYVKHLYTLGALQKDHTTFIKFVKPIDIPSLYTMPDIFICPSQWQEPLARVHYEAMAAGLPIITSNRGGNKEVIEEGKNGYIIDDYENPHSYGKIVNELFHKGAKREEIGRNGRKIAVEKYNWHTVANNLLAVYKSVVKE